jgi:hypothetical protein
MTWPPALLYKFEGKGGSMKVYELKSELEKVSKVIPQLRQDLDEVYKSETGKKSRIKLLWKEYQDRYNEIRNSKIYTTLQ